MLHIHSSACFGGYETVSENHEVAYFKEKLSSNRRLSNDGERSGPEMRGRRDEVVHNIMHKLSRIPFV